ncbi:MULTISPECIES: C39 family peptidase [unclassified Methanosarcina]|uniref:C39 family peptidase n=1 Tax=unclassified Methanosarcina TaxID=2644672 RepID=UPI000615C269|nr:MULTISPECIES: C39 family peptidase [unclassified Methanosarcina]AKB17879.1 GTPases - Sulfate adenylate transferase subunit 1 [Methanosarcina sp. WWM596]AKB21215.1 GTPases - Sulfate adenylate transferase subunit 1 [Methanosarcina sp. WH1]
MIKNKVTADEAFKHANAHMISFIAADADFEEWKEASIDSKPLELYDPTGQKLYHQFSVYKDNNIIGRIYIGADKQLGASVQLISFYPKPFDATEAMKKSIEIAKNECPDGSIESTKMVVYDYPAIGAMTVVKDKTTGYEHRIFVDAYTLDIVEDEPATETESGIWSIYEHRLKNGTEENLKDWQKSDQLTKYIEQEATDKGIDINVPITKDKIQKLIDDSVIKLVTSKTLNVPLYGQEASDYCAAASGKMIAKYYNVDHTQTHIYEMMDEGGVIDDQIYYYVTSIFEGGLGKTGTFDDGTPIFSQLKSKINNYRPVVSLIPGHVRVCRGYSDTGVGFILFED